MITKPLFPRVVVYKICVETVIVLNCKQVSFLIEQDLHLNIAITSLIWLTMLESGVRRPWGGKSQSGLSK